MGRAAVLLVIGTSTILLFFGKAFNNVSTEALTNSLTYYASNQRDNITRTGAHLACTRIFKGYTAIGTYMYKDVSFNGGRFSVYVDKYGTSSDTILVDVTGYFYNPNPGAIGLDTTTTQNIRVVLASSDFSKFALYAGQLSSGSKFNGGDIIDGPIHVNGDITINTPGGGKALFLDKVSVTGSIKPNKSKGDFKGDLVEGASEIPFPSATDELNNMIDAGGLIQNGGDLYVKFVGDVDGHVQYKTSAGGTWKDTTLSPGSSIVVKGGTLHIQGTVKGKITVGSKKDGSTGGNITVEDQITYASSGNNMLGVVSENNLTIMNNKSGVSKFTMSGVYYAGNEFNLERDNIAQTLYVFGGFMINKIGSTAWGPNGNKDFHLHLKYDTNIANNKPDYFPYARSGAYEVLSWYE